MVSSYDWLGFLVKLNLRALPVNLLSLLAKFKKLTRAPHTKLAFRFSLSL
jgi:hypothetical protein